mmetsp:Transcript_36720/g.116908  ORF Transcript_36720/g.116908 Transcript_36720/m.116908 type:complete len:233 (+) Transcript_36720:820-1518(+)
MCLESPNVRAEGGVDGVHRRGCGCSSHSRQFSGRRRQTRGGERQQARRAGRAAQRGSPAVLDRGRRAGRKGEAGSRRGETDGGNTGRERQRRAQPDAGGGHAGADTGGGAAERVVHVGVVRVVLQRREANTAPPNRYPGRRAHLQPPAGIPHPAAAQHPVTGVRDTGGGGGSDDGGETGYLALQTREGRAQGAIFSRQGCGRQSGNRGGTHTSIHRHRRTRRALHRFPKPDS